MKIILFNGPPRSGKDTASQLLMNRLNYLGRHVMHYRFATPLKDAVHAMFGMPALIDEHFTEVKDMPCEKMFGLTPREAYIWMSEECAKPKFGNDFFARVAARRIKYERLDKEDLVVISDCGFQQEADVLIENFGSENVMIVQMMRSGCNFDRDSRKYISHPDLNMVRLLGNSGTPGDLDRDLIKLLGDFIGLREGEEDGDDNGN